VNSGGEPERDETGLPPVDIEIPDDARELDRDVQAYYREQRALRRHLRSVRLRNTLSRDGIVLPLLACCLILALITGTLLTVFTAASDVGPLQPGTPGVTRSAAGASGSAGTSARPATGSRPVAHGSANASTAAPTGSASGRKRSAAAPSGRSASAGSPSGKARPGRAASAGAASGRTASGGAASGGTGAARSAVIPAGVPRLVRASGPLPGTALQVGERSIPMRLLTRAILVLIPLNCDCGPTVARLADQATRTGANAYLIGAPGATTQVRQLAAQLPKYPGSHAKVASDLAGSLRSSYPHTGLTAILVGPHGSVSYATQLRPTDDLTGLARALGG